MNNMDTATVVIINHNGIGTLKSMLTSCIESIKSLENENWTVDLVFVDNASNDGSVTLAKNLLKRADFEWALITEGKLGVNNARNAGLNAASGNYIIFLDSDVSCSKGWANAYLNSFKEHPDIRVFAGRVQIGTTPRNLPRWVDLDGEYSWPSIIVRCDNGSEELVTKLTKQGIMGPVGPNMGFRKELFEEVGPFDPSFGLRPGSLVPGAEAEFFHRISSEEYAYVPNGLVAHPIRDSQITKKYYLRRLEGTGRVLARVQHKQGILCKQVFGINRFRVRQMAYAYFKYFCVLALPNSKRRFYHRCKIAVALGSIKEDLVIANQK